MMPFDTYRVDEYVIFSFCCLTVDAKKYTAGVQRYVAARGSNRLSLVDPQIDSAWASCSQCLVQCTWFILIFYY